MRKIFTILPFVIFFASTFAASPEKRPKVGLVLSGGGAKGFAHVGVLKVLEEVGIPIDYIAGTSIGSIVGGFYAMGYSADSLEKIVKGQDWEMLLSNDVSPEYISPIDKAEQARYNLSFLIESKRIALSTGLLNGQSVMDLLCYQSFAFHGITDFSKLPIPFLCIAADLSTGKEVVLKSGYLPLAIRASMAVPAAISAVDIDGKLLVDGGIVNNFPVDRCKEMGADIIIGVDIMDSLKTPDQIIGIQDVIGQMVSLMSIQRSDDNAKDVDVYIRPYLHGYSASSFSHAAADSLIKRGEEAARRVYPQLVRLRDSLHLKPSVHPEMKQCDNNTLLDVNRIEVVGTEKSTITFFLGQIGIQKGEKVSLGQIRKSIARLYATGNYEFVNYRIIGDNEKTLQLSVKERSNNRLNAGLHYDSDLKSSVLLNATLRNHNLYGSRFSFDAKLSNIPMFAARYSLDRGWKPGIFAGAMYAEDRFYRYDGTTKNAEVNINLSQFQLSSQSFLSQASRLTLGASVERYKLGPVIGEFPREDVQDQTFFNLEGQFDRNTLNNNYFPTKGIKINVFGKLVTNNGKNEPYAIGNLSILKVQTLTDRLTLLPSFYTRVIFGKNISFFHKSYFGGVQQTDYLGVQVPFYGLRRMEIITQNVGVVSLEARYKMWNKIYLSLIGQVGTYNDLNHNFAQNKWVYGSGLRLGVHNNMIGPLELMLSTSNYNDVLVPFFSLGYWF